ncbi:hypothetical protein Q4599_09630 [Cellulophaga lytica]|uniref:hypothetical protein n=1 Tax=Cellulophaga lytica TaxID=979 RepID=UPI0026E2837D|nr:hypothetical protein [Cellulophaga lytica]MDO6853841.1 hypothetical protein [Cellulophaga lytica]
MLTASCWSLSCLLNSASRSGSPFQRLLGVNGWSGLTVFFVTTLAISSASFLAIASTPSLKAFLPPASAASSTVSFTAFSTISSPTSFNAFLLAVAASDVPPE